MSKIAQREFFAELLGHVNGAPIELSGLGTVDSMSGVTSGTYTLSRMPPDFDPRLLSACLITGYPNVCAARQLGVENPFGDHAYEYQRTIDFGNRGELKLKTTCEYAENRLLSRFELTGNIVAKDLCSVEPIIESWEPSYAATINGKFTIAWRDGTGQFLIGHAKTKYKIKSDVLLNRMLNRYIRINPQMSAAQLSLHQQSELFHSIDV